MKNCTGNMRILFIASVITTLCYGCEHKEAALVDTSAGFPTEKAVGLIATNDAPRPDIIRAFGTPLTEDQLADGRSVALYMGPPPNAHTPTSVERFSGFQVYYKSNRVVEWKPIYGTYTTTKDETNYSKITLSTNDRAKMTNVLSFCIVSDVPLENETFFDTPKMPNLGFIKAEPDLTVHRIKSIQEALPKAGDRNGSDSFIIHLMDSDADALRRITTDNIGKKLLLRINGNPILAPRISMPIENGVLQMSNISEEEALTLRALQGLANQPSP
jgi:hypothetical protein